MEQPQRTPDHQSSSAAPASAEASGIPAAGDGHTEVGGNAAAAAQPASAAGFREGFTLGTALAGSAHGRTGIIHTPHGDIHTPAFIPVGTKATVKTLTPDQIKLTGAQAILGNAYHLYLQPGADLVDEAGGLAKFARWDGPTYTDSGGFQVMSLGAGYKKVISMTAGEVSADEVRQKKDRLAHVDEEGVNFRSVIDGSKHRFTPEVSMAIQHQLGADIMFAFDELTTLVDSRRYQEQSVERTHRWAKRCLTAHNELTESRHGKPPQSLWGVVQGAHYEDLRRIATRGLVGLSQEFEAEGRRGFGGYGIGGALEKENLGTIVGWVCDELPADRPRHLLGISEPDDVFVAVENGADTFDCVAPTRLGRRGGVYTLDGRTNLKKACYTRDFRPVDAELGGYVSENFDRAYIHHLIKAKEFLAGTLCTIHNLFFMVTLVDNIRASIDGGYFAEYKQEFLGRYYAGQQRQ
ncbi:tRNA guanosine(34) transglycosylase Tgt [Corynebacterium choanae]|nr:tRNA guanosine(34) transglycosylase Tgt [Corynebacterium choanae]